MSKKEAKDGKARKYTRYVLKEESVNDCRRRYVGLLPNEIYGI